MKSAEMKSSIRILMVLMLALPLKLMASTTPLAQCLQSLKGASWPPQDWHSYLQGLAETPPKNYPEKRISIEPQRVSSPPEDYRFYLVPKFLMRQQEIERLFTDEVFKKLMFANLPYQYSYRDRSSGDDWAVFTSEHGDEFNINVSLFPPKDSSFQREYQRIANTVNTKTTNSQNDGFFENATYLHGAWNKRSMHLLHQNEMWPESSGMRLEYYPIGAPLGDKNDHLMVLNELIFYREDHLIVQNIRRFRSPESRQENLTRGQHYLGALGAEESDVLKKGQQKFTNMLMEIHEAIFPDYVERRGWSREFIEKLFNDVRLMQDQIEFTLIRELTPDLKFGKIVGMVGFNTSAYGHVEYFDNKQNQWIKTTGLTGSSAARYHSSLIPFGDANYETELWSTPIAQLPIENYLIEGKTLPRPSVLERIERPSTKHPDIKSEPILFSSGENLEVTRLWVSKDSNQRKHIFAKILYAWIHRIYQSHQTLDYTLKGMSHITYNPEKEGRRLYSPFGYEIDPELELKQDTLKKAVTFISNSGNFMKAISHPSFLEDHLSEDEMRAVVFYLNDSLYDIWQGPPPTN